MLFAGALTVSFTAQATKVKNHGIASSINKDAEVENITKSTDANVFGHVVDVKTREHIPYVIIHVKGTTLATATDRTGHFFLKNMPEGTFVIEAKYMGYTTQSKSVTIKKDETKEVNFSLSPNDLILDEVVVSANRSETE